MTKGWRARDELLGEERVVYPYCDVQCLSRETVGDDPAKTRIAGLSAELLCVHS
jgi:hypothetical protein